MAIYERRENPRQRVHYFTTIRQPSENGDAFLPQTAYSRDISDRGLFFYTQTRVEEGEEILLTIYPAGNWSGGGILAKLKVRAKILRVKRTPAVYPSGDAYGVAVRFLHEPSPFIGEMKVESLAYA
jgi:hypothetical protein